MPVIKFGVVELDCLLNPHVLIFTFLCLFRHSELLIQHADSRTVSVGVLNGLLNSSLQANAHRRWHLEMFDSLD